jgi:hypothetical protein
MNQPLRPADDAAVPASGQTQTQGGQAQTHGSPGQRQDQDQAQDQAQTPHCRRCGPAARHHRGRGCCR